MIGWIDDKDCLVSALSSTKEKRKQSKGVGRGALYIGKSGRIAVNVTFGQRHECSKGE